MPLYEYKCPAGHVETHLRRDKPDVLPCPCGESARPILSLTAVGKVVGGTDGGKLASVERGIVINEIGRGLILIDWQCDACGKTAFDVVEERPETKPTCECGTVMHEKIGVPDVDWFTKESSGDPRGVWSQAAGRWFTSKADRARWMEENNMVDGNDVDSDALRRAESVKSRENNEYINRMCDEFEHDPAIRSMRASGRVRDWNILRPDRDLA